MTNPRILAHFQESADLKMKAASVLAQPIEQAIELMFTALSNGNKILACGNGGSAADSQHFAAELVGRFERERLPLIPAGGIHTFEQVRTLLAMGASAVQIGTPFAVTEEGDAHPAFKQVLADAGLKMPQLAMPVRVLVMGTPQTPSVDQVLFLCGREKVLARLAKR